MVNSCPHEGLWLWQSVSVFVPDSFEFRLLPGANSATATTNGKMESSEKDQNAPSPQPSPLNEYHVYNFEAEVGGPSQYYSYPTNYYYPPFFLPTTPTYGQLRYPEVNDLSSN